MGRLEVFFILLSASTTLILILKNIKIESTLGYLLAGILLGPHCLELMSNTGEIKFFGELGIILLLFTIGLELPIKGLKRLRVFVFYLGAAQVLITGSILTFVILKFFHFSFQNAFLIGFALSFSSTALILQILFSNSELSSKAGRLTFCVLLFQDLAVVPMLIFFHLMKSNESIAKTLAGVSINVLAVLIAIVILGKLVLKPAFKMATEAKGSELFLAMTLIIVLGVSILTLNAGLSLELGAFLAGLLISETNYRHQVEVEVNPFRSILLGLFFVSVGMEIKPHIVVEYPLTIFSIIVSLVVFKSIILLGINYLFKVPLAASVRASLLLSGSGEFVFVLLSGSNGIDDKTSNIIFSSVVISMILTPLISVISKKFIISNIENKDESADYEEDISNHIIIIGFDYVGQKLANIFEQNDIKYIAIDYNMQRVEDLRTRGYPVFYGNTERLEAINMLNINRSNSVIITLKNVNDSLRTSAKIQNAYPGMKMIIRIMNSAHKKKLDDAGIEAHFGPIENISSVHSLGKATLQNLGFSEGAEKIVDQYIYSEVKMSR